MWSKGQTLMEVIIAATVGMLVVSALTYATIFSLRNASFAKNSTQATKLAQEGIERVKVGRDRGYAITGNFQLAGQDVTAWDDNDLWSNPVYQNCTPKCYFNINSSGELQYRGSGSSIPANAEVVGQFKRVVILTDDSSYQLQKTATVIVTWSDFSGAHESRLTTILRKL